MVDDVAKDNVNRAYSLAATSIAIFTFMMIFLYPRYVNGEINVPLFQVTLVVMGVATFSFVLAAFHYYASSMIETIDEGDRVIYARRGNRLWIVGYTLLFLAPSLILFTVALYIVGAVWLVLWLVYVVFAMRYFPLVQADQRKP
jgi:hypothetical protein